jgi:mono/diheme cytochrome c family protein
MKNICLLIIFGLMTACGSDHQVEGGEIDAAKVSASFASMERAFFVPNCVGCHSQFASYSGVMREIDSIASEVTSGHMPKVAPLPANLQNCLKLWIAKGTPEVEGKPAKPPVPVALAPTWESLLANVFTPRCVVCHNPRGSAKFLDLSTVDAIFNQRDKVLRSANGKKLLDFNNPANSFLLDSVQDTPPAPAKRMPPADLGMPALSEAEKDTLRDWIALGLPIFLKGGS